MFSLQIPEFLILGSLLGLTAGISPGPLLTLVLTQTLKHNKTEGIKIAISPLITDLPIIVLTLLVFYKLDQFNTILAVIAFIGGIFLAYLGYTSFMTKGLAVNNANPNAASVKKGIFANMLNPHPYVFWATIGTPYVFKAFDISLLTVILFFISFYMLLIGSKVALALIVSRSKKRINQKAYIIIMKVLGVILFAFSLLFFYDAIKYLGYN